MTKELGIEDLPGVGTATAEKLINGGFDNLMGIAVATTMVTFDGIDLISDRIDLKHSTLTQKSSLYEGIIKYRFSGYFADSGN
jgi:hypothetical protein